jgi:Spy/CpxP family protein refolding chaperone
MKNTLFRGISLTSEQRGQLDTINNKYRSQRESIRRAMQPDLQEARTARQRGDTTAARAAWARTAEQRKQLQTLQEQQLGEIRGTLTSDQQQRFDQNRAARRSKMHGHRTPKPASGA